MWAKLFLCNLNYFFYTIAATVALTFREIKHDIPQGDWNLCWDMYLWGRTIKTFFYDVILYFYYNLFGKYGYSNSGESPLNTKYIP